MKYYLLYTIFLFIFCSTLPCVTPQGGNISIDYLYSIDGNFFISNKKVKIKIFQIIESENEYSDRFFQNKKSDFFHFCFLIVPFVPGTFFAVQNRNQLEKLFFSKENMKYQSKIFHMNSNEEISKIDLYNYHIEIQKKHIQELSVIIYDFFVVENNNEKVLLFSLYNEIF